MKWIIGGVLLYLFLNSQNVPSTSAPGMTNQTASGTPLGIAQRMAQQVGTILTDITGSPTRADNNSPALGNPASNPVYPNTITPNYGM